MVKVFIAASNSDIVACFAVSVGAHPFALQSAAIVRLVLTLLSCIARGRPLRFKFCGSVFFLSAVASSSLTWLCASWSAGNTRLGHVRKDRPVFMSGGAFELYFAWHRFLGCCSRLFIVSLLVLEWVCCDTQGIRVFLLFFQHLLHCHWDLEQSHRCTESERIFAVFTTLVFCTFRIVGTDRCVSTGTCSTRVALPRFLHGLRDANLALHRT